MSGSPRIGRRFLAPEVVQTSAMDCGPATLTCLLEGFGIRASYGRLREACQTDLDGTSIDTIEEVARQAGLDAEQILIPLDHLLAPRAPPLPALLVVRAASGATHFVVVWRRHGRVAQVMDPARGRTWVSARKLLADTYVHETSVDAAAWRAWAGSSEFLLPLAERMRALGLPAAACDERIGRAAADPSWTGLATLDAATRAAQAVLRAGGARRGESCRRVLDALVERAAEGAIPTECWSARLDPTVGEGETRLVVRGAVLVRVSGVLATEREPEEPRSRELEAALAAPRPEPGRELLRLLAADGLAVPAALLAALGAAAAGVIVEALVFRGLLHVGSDLGLVSRRLLALGALLVFVAALALLEIPLATGVLRLGRRLELRLRLAFLRKIPRLADRYFHSRLASDMAERCHSLYQIRELPEIARQLAFSGFGLLFTVLGILWLDPRSAPAAALLAIVAVAVPLASQAFLAERDLRVRTHVGALGRFYFDALLGLVPIRCHRAGRSVRREHEELLSHWVGASVGLYRGLVTVEAVQFLCGFGIASWIVVAHAARGGAASTVLLLVYWALSLPVLGQSFALAARQIPEVRNLTLRLLEPIGAAERRGSDDGSSTAREEDPPPAPAGVGIVLDDVSVRAAGHDVLRGIRLAIASGEHVGIVGPSGAGKSTLVGLLLGWHEASSGHVLVDDEPLDATVLARLRARTAWVDPTVQIWNRSLLDNLRYGSSEADGAAVGRALETADMRRLVERLPDGLQTALGEGGALVSGGEGQRVRLARALLRDDVRLAILDEPFRGLDRGQRARLLAAVRDAWRGATVLCITHDVADAASFGRVLVIEDGSIAEDGAPDELIRRPGSRLSALLEAERALRDGVWAGPSWRRLRLDEGRIVSGDA